jgi:L-iditol 2-dehydrogenase
VPGFLRERVNLPATNLLPIPASLPFDVATLHEPLAVALHSLHFARIEVGENVLVIGAGPIGLLTIASLKLARPGRIWAVEPLAHRRELALRVGADAVLDPGQGDAAREILRETGGRGADCAIDCAAKEDTTNLGIRALRNAGRLVLTGIHSECFVPIEVSPMRRKELAIFNVRRSNHEGQAAVELLIGETARFAPLVTHTRPLSGIADAFRIAENYEDGVGKMVIRPD